MSNLTIIRGALEDSVDIRYKRKNISYYMCCDGAEEEGHSSACLQIAALAALDEMESAKPNTYWVLFDASAEKKYIKKKADDGCLMFFDTEKEAQRAKARSAKTDYKKIESYAHPPLAQAVPGGYQLVSDTAIAGLVELVNEVVKSHSDSESCEYQECELEPCLYCQDAAKFISLLSTTEKKEAS